MSRSLAQLAARKQVLSAEIELQRMQLELHLGDARAALRPAGLLGGALARPTALLALVNTIAPFFGRRVARIARLAALALAAFRIARVWRSRVPAAQETSAE
ncbi:MAG TPA: hypothetical protein VL742_19635 [Casimicrobiaceae bacterium]|nr:hypothetical protein [Casimicrobiaceae bacterium]